MNYTDVITNAINSRLKNPILRVLEEIRIVTLLNESIYISKQGDFLVNDKYTFEIGGKNKSFKQIKELANSFVVSDNIEIGFGSKISLWLFMLI